MRRHRLHYVPVLALLAAMLGGCASARYQNATHPNYGDAEYKADLTQCRSENSKTVTVSGHYETTEVQVDEAKARSCMTARGWQPASR